MSWPLFLIGDGVLQLLKEQQPAAILQRHYAPTFKMLELYDIEEVYVCADSLAERGVTVDDLLIPVESAAPGTGSALGTMFDSHQLLRSPCCI